MIDIFGYLKTYDEELKLKHIKEYRKYYCTLCYGLRNYLGLSSAVLLNYESVFLFILLDGIIEDEECEEVCFRCPLNPLKQQCCKINRDILEYVSFIDYQLSLVKVEDNCRDTKKVKYKVLRSLMSNRKRYNELLKKYSRVVQKIEEHYSDLYALEQESSTDFDGCSATMGAVLYDIIKFYFDLNGIYNDEVLELAKHIGIYIYLIDAYDDYEKDKKKKLFNPLNGFDEMCTEDNSGLSNLMFAETMLGMMIGNMKDLVSSIKIQKHKEIIINTIEFGTVNAVLKIKNKKKRM